MNRKLPLCAQCGGSLARKGRSIILWQGLDGRPSVGWCDDCQWGQEDPALQRLELGREKGRSDEVIESVLREIEARGERRVVRAKAKAKKVGVMTKRRLQVLRALEDQRWHVESTLGTRWAFLRDMHFEGLIQGAMKTYGANADDRVWRIRQKGLNALAGSHD